MNDFENSDKGI